jgi:Polyketide cyclase / dehydrase and lipid transport
MRARRARPRVSYTLGSVMNAAPSLHGKVASGTPLATHRGEVSVRADGSGSRVRWAVRFRSRVPLTGRLSATLLHRSIARALAGLATALLQEPENDRRHP